MDNFEVRKLDGHKAIVYLKGRLDVAVAGQIEEHLMELIEEEKLRYLVLNMEAVEYMSSSGFRVAIALLRRLKDEGGSLKISNLRPAVKRIFDVIELTSLFEIFESEDSALASLPAL